MPGQGRNRFLRPILRQQLPKGTCPDPEARLDQRATGQGTVRRRSAKRQERHNWTEHCFPGGSVLGTGPSQGSAETRHPGQFCAIILCHNHPSNDITPFHR